MLMNEVNGLSYRIITRNQSPAITLGLFTIPPKIDGVALKKSSAHVLCRFIRPQSLVRSLPQQPIGGPGQKSHLADQLGANPGNARKVERRSKPRRSRPQHIERRCLHTKRLEHLVKAAQLGSRHASADTPRIDELPAIIIVGEQESAEIRPGALWLAVADNYELFSFVALGLAPKTAITRHIARVHALRDDAFGLGSASGLQEAAAVADMMVAVLNRRRRASKQCLEALFPLDEGRAGQVLSVEKQKIEDEVDKVHRTAVIRCCLKLGK